MIVETKSGVPNRSARAEVQQLVSEFVSSGMRRSEFCRSRGLSFGTLNRHPKKQFIDSNDGVVSAKAVSRSSAISRHN
jgi:hypothetical protein